MSTVELFTPDANFWEVNQQFKITNPFKTVYKNDKSKGKKISSLHMWFVALCYDQNSHYYKQPVEDKHKLIGEDYCGNETYYEDNQDLLDDLIEAFINMQDSPARRALRDWEVKIVQRAKFLREATYTFDEFVEDDRGKWITKKGTADQLDKMLGNTKKLFDDYQRILKDLSTEEAEDGVMGGEMESLID
jgi:hypothetical protein